MWPELASKCEIIMYVMYVCIFMCVYIYVCMYPILPPPISVGDVGILTRL